MRKRYVIATCGALIMLVLELSSMPFLISSGAVAAFVRYVLYGPWTLGTELLVSAREDLGLPLPSGGMTPLPYGLNVGLLFFNWGCYAALGFLLGWKLAGSPRRASKPA
jgi:hypothetical protein